MANGTDWLTVESLDLEAQGVAHRADGKVVFIEGALPGERVQVQVSRKKNQWEQGQMTSLARESAQRVRPGCPHFGLHAGACGGCKMQHLHPAAQVAVKQRVLEDNLWHLAKVRPECLLRPIEGPAWGYRDRARLSVRHVAKKGTVLIGFHERKSRYVADMSVCAVLPPAVSAMLLPLRELIGAMEQRDRLPQIELAAGHGADGPVTALVLRHLEPLSESDRSRLRAFAAVHGVQWWLQPKGPETVQLLDEGGPVLAYRLPEFGITMPFKPTDFTQVNPHINRVLVERALRLLAPQADERVIDWFCGLGNFTLPLATRARSVLGIEGSETLVARARANAATNGLAANTEFAARNLFELTPADLRALGTAQRWLVDPPREGAFALAKAVADLHRAPGWTPPQRIVYVSCNPSTLARDAGLLVHQAGYRCTQAGVVNMFPHTAHVESMAVFEFDPQARTVAVEPPAA
ncbi:23S rRNA (uracil(1939)-C(5))-methyltransferase RlmD [Rubrivivax sp. A210]|uniref:23S rRNA (uracil(1939)-C(5))-methyltransferase RlmD n=1 Tax=Rubrivivax sp. A210 TaxID=2772301 RepID=UPI001919161E|nr:23S rRNA (uracil(1939)-C(5))-methyltransferase RlmD [Rubrivivax sp. A210]CAD5373933.1 23S rRNA (uracil(1939)-C(5))-methyltransferase RlmD [Rubrivivax sp. A210]